MTILQQPATDEVAMNMTDFIIDTDTTINFCVKFGGQTILSEDYVPDANWQVRTHKLGKFLAQALWGLWPSSNVFDQNHLKGSFEFYIDDVLQCSSNVVYSCRYLKGVTNPVFLTNGTTKITRPGVLEWLTVNAAGVDVSVTAVDGYGSDSTVPMGTVNDVTTFDASMDRVTALLGFAPVGEYVIKVGTAEFRYVVDHNHYAEVFQFRYRNVYDAPETVSCVGDVKLKGAEKASTGYLYGVERKFDVRANDEYTANSGVIFLGSEYKYWHDFLNTREAEILIDDEWYPIIVSKQNYEREFRKDRLKAVEFSFRFADPDQNGLI
ncbi:MAG: hypothetical protein IJW56_02510 [Bacteroides sp.]|nr:hypothetical protein [Bacteroides sp.]